MGATVLALGLLGSAGWATPHPLSVAERAELAALVRTFFETTRDGGARRAAVYPTPEEVRGLYPSNPGPRADAGAAPSGYDAMADRQAQAMERDARELRAVFRGGVYVDLAPAWRARASLDVRRCGRFARAETQCADGPVFEYTVGSERRRFRIDTLVRVRGHWRVLDARE
jgi:hypothetical protein